MSGVMGSFRQCNNLSSSFNLFIMATYRRCSNFVVYFSSVALGARTPGDSVRHETVKTPPPPPPRQPEHQEARPERAQTRVQHQRHGQNGRPALLRKYSHPADATIQCYSYGVTASKISKRFLTFCVTRRRTS